MELPPLSPYSIIAHTSDFPEQLFASQQPMYPAGLGLGPLAEVESFASSGEDNHLSDEKIRMLKHAGTLHTHLRVQLEVNMRRNDVESSKRVGNTFIQSIKLLKSGAFSSSHAKELIAALQIAVPFLSKEDTHSCFDRLFLRFEPSSDACIAAGHAKCLELLPYLVSKCSASMRMATVERICSLTWDGHSAMMLTASLADLCETLEESSIAIRQVHQLMRWNPHISAMPRAQLEDLPGLLYNVNFFINSPSLANVHICSL